VRVDSAVEGAVPGTPLSLFGGYRIGQPLSASGIQPYYRERETYPAGELRAGLSVPVWRNLLIDRRRATITRAELGQDSARQGQALQRIEVLRLAAVRYFEWVAAGMRHQVASELLAIAQLRDQQLSVRVKTGDVPFFDQQDNLRAVAQRQALKAQTQRGIEQASFELALFLRDAEGAPTQPTPGQLPSSLPNPDPTFGDDATLEDALNRRPDVQRLIVQKRQQQVEVSLQQNQLWPSIDLGLVFSQDLGGRAGTADPKLNIPEFEFSALIDVPLLYRQPLGRIRAAEAGVARIEAQLRLVRDRVAADLKDARSALDAARARVRFTLQEVDVARKLEAGERQKFELGDSNLLFVNLRETQTAEAQLREIDALLDYHRAVAAFRAAIADPLAPHR
jgi:outer membrane protein TolC